MRDGKVSEASIGDLVALLGPGDLATPKEQSARPAGLVGTIRPHAASNGSSPAAHSATHDGLPRAQAPIAAQAVRHIVHSAKAEGAQHLAVHGVKSFEASLVAHSLTQTHADNLDRNENLVIPHPLGSAAILVPQALSHAPKIDAAQMLQQKIAQSGLLQHLDSNLATLYLQHQGEAPSVISGGGLTETDSALSRVGNKDYVTVDLTAKDGNSLHLLHQLGGLHIKNAAHYGDVVSARVAVSDIAALNKLGDIGHASESVGYTNVGDVTTQADSAQHDDLARTNFNVDGTGIKIGVISDSFDQTSFNEGNSSTPDTTLLDQMHGDLPSGSRLNIIQDHAGGEDEGRGMAQLIHDLAPGASIDFYSGSGGQAALATAIDALTNDGCNIIVDDLYYTAEPYYQDGIAAQAVDRAVAHGVTYFSSAGNASDNGYEATSWVDSGVTDPGTGDHLAKLTNDAQSQFLTVTFQPGSLTDIVLDWDQPAASAGGASCASNLDLFVYDSTGTNLLFSQTDNNIGNNPIEDQSLTYNGTGTITAKIAVGLAPGSTAPGAFKLMSFDHGSGVTFESTPLNTSTATVYGHAAAKGAIAVGAAYYGDTPQYGTSPAIVEDFSAQGPTRILFDIEGNRLPTPDIRQGPDIVAVDGGNTTFFPHGADSDGDGWPNFFGTSAAAPDAAATAALMLEARSTLNHSDILNLLEDTAGNMGTPGFDSTTGFGLINANSAVGAAKTLDITGNKHHEVLTGTHLNDTFTFASDFGNTSFVNGLGGTDTLALTGGANTVFNSSTIRGIEAITLGAGHNYTLTLAQGNVLSNHTLEVDGAALQSTKVAKIDGSALTTGSLQLIGGAGNDVLIGGANKDTIRGGLGADRIKPGGGQDVVVYKSAPQSTSTHYDTIVGFDMTQDKFNLPGTVTGIGAAVHAKLDTANLDSELAADLTAKVLKAHQALLFTASSGTLKGDVFLIIDGNGSAGYQKGHDFVIDLYHAAHLSSLSTSDFI